MNPVLRIIEQSVAEHAERLPLTFSMALEPAQWEELWKHPIKDGRGAAPRKSPSSSAWRACDAVQE